MLSQRPLVSQVKLEFVLKHSVKGRVRNDLVGLIVSLFVMKEIQFINQSINQSIVTHTPVGWFHGGQLLELDQFSGESVLAVSQLNKGSVAVSHGAVVSDHDRLLGFDQTTLNVTSFGGLDGSIDQTWDQANRGKKILVT